MVVQHKKYNENNMDKTFQSALNLMSEGKLADAELLLNTLNQASPVDDDILSLLGNCLMKQGKLQDAINVFKELVSHHRTAQNFGLLASALLSNGHAEEAEHAYREAVSIDSNYSEAWHLLGNLLMQRGEAKESTTCFANAQQTDPFKPYFAEIKQLMDSKRFADAERGCRNVLQRHPNHPQALYYLSVLASQVGAFEDAIDILNFALRYSPYHPSIWDKLASFYSELGHYEQAIEACKRLIKLDDTSAFHWMKLAGNLTHIGQNEQSLKAYEKAQAFAPERANIELQKGHMHKVLGNRDACENAYKQCLAMEKINGAAYWALADLKSYHFSDDEITDMEALVAKKDVPKGQVSQAYFALGKGYEDKKDYEKAFAYYEKANQTRPDVNFTAQEFHEKNAELMQSFSSELLKGHASTEQDEVTPIFIVGLPRSGSTLIEQILSSHSAVEGTGELFNLPRLIRRINIEGGKRQASYPESLAKFSPQELRAFGQTYIEQTKVYRTNKPYFIDKAPPNFLNIGLIHLILPNAIIIDARRHPLSTGFSNFKQHYANGHDFSYSLENIGHYFNGYMSLMAHWNEVLPNKVLTVQYENMVKDTENQVRTLLAHCNLPFEQECLDFYKNKRAVRTSSSEQVRQPINKKGMEQWKHFEPYLSQLKEALGEETLNQFEQWL